MKLLRLIVALLALLLVLAAGAVGALFLPSVQTRLARAVLARSNAIKGTVNSVDAGLATSTWNGLQLQGNGWELTMPSARVDIPALAALRRNVHVHSFSAHGWVLAFSPIASEKGTAAAIAQAHHRNNVLATIGLNSLLAELLSPTPTVRTASADVFRGILPLLDLPVDLALDQVDLDGEIIFRSQTGGPLERIHVNMTGGDLAASKSGRFLITGDSTVKVPSMPWSSVQAHITLQARLANPRQFDLLDLKGTLDAASAPKKTSATQLLLTASVSRETERETYTLAVRTAGNADARDLFQLTGNFPDAQKRVSGSWKTDANDVSFIPFLLGATLPSFAVKGEGRFEADNSFQEVHATGKFAGEMARWETIDPALVNLGKLKIDGNFDLLQNGKTVRIEGLSVQVANDKPVLAVTALQGIELDGASGEVRVADPRKDLVKVTLAGLPIAWVQPFLSGVNLSGDALRGELIARARETGLSVRSTEPLVCADLNLSSPDRALLQHADAVMNVTGMYSPEGWQADVSGFELRTGGRTWLNASAKVGKSSEPGARLKSTGHYQLDLIGGSRQPLFAQLRIFQGGQAEGDFSAIMGALHQFAATVEMKSLAIAGLAPPLPSASLLVRADVMPSGALKLQVPFQIQHGSQHSDGQLSADLHAEGKDHVFDAQLTSDLVSIDDLVGLLSAFNAATSVANVPAADVGVPATATASAATFPAVKSDGTSAPSPASEARWGPTRPTFRSGDATTSSVVRSKNAPGVAAAPLALPAWAGNRGRLLIGLRRVTDLSAGFEANDVAGRMMVEPTGITFDHLTATLGDNGNAALAATLAFDGKGSGSYALNGELNLNRVNPARYLQAVAKDRKPTVEGIFDLTMTFSGEALTLDQLDDALTEEVKLTSRSGKFRGFAPGSQAVDIDKLQRTASTVGALLSAAAGMVGYGEGVSYSDKLRAGADALHEFSEIDYDQLNVEMRHPAGQETKISDISLISPEIRFVGNGTVDTTGERDWFARPLHLQVAVAVRGRQAENLKKIGLVGADKDTLGYVPLLEKFPIDGSASSLATDTLGRLLNRALAK